MRIGGILVCQKPPITDGWHDEHNYLQQVVFDARNTTNNDGGFRALLIPPI